ncbi:MAG TPA: LamG-like jellyroll fold domain-containing protein [Candidatus Paceibacterota bacterium]
MKIKLAFLFIFSALIIGSATLPVANAAGADPVAYWDFNEGSGDIVHDKIGSSDGTAYGASWIDGALSFNGSGNYVQIPDSPALNPTTAVTVSMWIKPATIGGIALSKGGQYRLIAGDVSPTKLSARLNTTSTGWGVGGVSGNSDLTINNWQHVALTYDGSSRKIYYNGNLDTEIADSGTIFDAYANYISYLYFGDYTIGSTYSYKGLIDDVKIYNRALSASELATEFTNGRTTITPVVLPACSSWTYTDWSSCSSNGNQTRSVTSSSPSSCVGGNPVLSQICTYTPPVTATPSCTSSDWSCASWGACATNSSQARTCTKIRNCQGGVSSPATSQSCAYTATPATQPPVYQAPQPSCTADTWSCGDWNSCSISGVQNRSCRKTFDCPNVETAPPVADRYCEAPSRPAQQVPQDSNAITNQDAIIKATVALACLFDENSGMLGSGTVIDPNGTILTNKHVVDGTKVCFVGFVSDFNDEPYFGDMQIADILKVSSTEDVAVLKLRNPQNKKLPSVNITKSNSDLRLGTKVNVYGYPADFGKNITYTSGDFSGTSGSYLKTTAIIEHGNSGGGSYLNDGSFIGVPTGVIRGELNAMGYILSINTINAWLGNKTIASNSNSNQNNFSRVSSTLEKIGLKELNSIKLVIPKTDSKGNNTIPFIAPATDGDTQKGTVKPQISQAQKSAGQPQFTRTLSIGSRGADVTALQQILISKGFLVGTTATGYFGSMTKAAVQKYQGANGISAIGTVGPLTRAKLNAS